MREACAYYVRVFTCAACVYVCVYALPTLPPLEMQGGGGVYEFGDGHKTRA